MDQGVCEAKKRVHGEAPQALFGELLLPHVHVCAETKKNQGVLYETVDRL